MVRLFNRRAAQVGVDYFTLTVDYSKKLKHWLKDYSGCLISSEITSSNFSLEGSGVRTITVALVHLNRWSSTEEALKELKRLGLRPATMQELLCFGVAHPEIHSQFPIAAFGSVWWDHNWPGIGCLDNLDDNRCHVGLRWMKQDWDATYRFLSVQI